MKTEWTGLTATCIEPGTTCIYEAVYGQAVTLTAKPDAGAVFSAWTGACAGQSATCHVTLDSVYPDILTSTNAVFGLPSPTSRPTPVPTAKPTLTPKASATPNATALPTTTAGETPSTAPASTSDATQGPGPAAPGSDVTPGPSLAPVSTASDSGVPVMAVVVIAALMLLVGALAVGLIFALRRRPS